MMTRRAELACCPECAQGIEEYPAGGYGYYPAGGSSALTPQGPNESAADYQRRVERHERAQRELQAASDRETALRGVQTATGTFSSAFSEAQQTERARIEAESRLAAQRSRDQAALEQARVEAARDQELARIRAAQPLPLQVLPQQSTTPLTERTDSGMGQFPVVPVLVVLGGGLGLWWLTRKGR